MSLTCQEKVRVRFGNFPAQQLFIDDEGFSLPLDGFYYSCLYERFSRFVVWLDDQYFERIHHFTFGKTDGFHLNFFIYIIK